MTDQVPNTCVFQGRRWDILDFDGNTEVIPTNKILGIYTVMESTANWAGRIDHFMIYYGKLYLFKVEVCLSNHIQNLSIPKNARREIITRTERVIKVDSRGEREALQDYKITNLIFDDEIVKFNGEIVLEYPHIDPWEYPQSAYNDNDMNYTERSTLCFANGELIDEEIECI